MRGSSFELRLDSPILRFGLVFTTAVPLLLLAFWVARLAWAEEQLDSRDLAAVERAIAVDPHNPALHHWAGTLHMYGTEWGSGASIRELRTATELNPHSSLYSDTLGQACVLAGDQVCAQTAYENAARLAPRNPRFQATLAAYYMMSGQTELGLSKLRDLLAMEPDSAGPILRTCLRMVDPGVVWRRLLQNSRDARSKVVFISILAESNKFADAQGFWQELVASGPRLTLEIAKSYMAQLETSADYEQLTRVWRDMEGLNSDMPARSSGDLVVNGDFAEPASNIGLDWHIRQEQFLTSAIVPDPDTRHALRLDFTVPNNAEHEPVFQILPVAPGQGYELRARVRSQFIRSDSGPQLRITDPLCAGCVNITSESTIGTTPWHDVRTTFVTPASTRFLKLSLYRPRSRSFPAEIQGRFWITAVSMRLLVQ